ncbi:hypothetical protein AU106_gp113 [Sinorhizobium phage phiM9]|uniref:Uncharacterized protein n=1 Tax=Sinorhizobium phage phiM9 TaxID=1636182 RepID=A0A0F6THI4_9CAUD|nr:hypothetical protein AU106_gp113 [Sinorhizobium phage phiM9]AKE44744.1 hypothetical protein Sm_phiM9_116 [Sinorhizobium phage phiM9]
MSQLRKFLAGDRSALPNYPTDILIWLNFEGYKYAKVKGKPVSSMIRRDDASSVSLEKYLSKFVEYLFHPDMSRMKMEELYVRFTNRMEGDDAEIIYQATEGKLQLDLDQVRAYAGDRRLAEDGAYVFRDEYLAVVPEPVVEPKPKVAAPAAALDGLGESLQSLDPGQDEGEGKAQQKSAEKPAKKPEAKPEAQPEKKGRGRGKKAPAK